MDALSTPRMIAHTPETGQIKVSLNIIKSQQLAVSAITDLLIDRNQFPHDLEPEGLANLIDTMMHAIEHQLDIIAENAEIIDVKARRAEMEGARHD